MQIRVQGLKTQCIRSVYDSEIKRSRQTVVAAFDRYADKIPSDGLEALTEAELGELRAWFEAKNAEKAASDKQRAVSIADWSLVRIADALADTDLSAEHAGKIWLGIEKLQKALRKAGHPKPKKAAKPVKKVLPGQADLI